MERTPIALKFCDEEFTLSDLRHVYEVIHHAAYNEDADVLRYADRIRSEEALTGGREFEERMQERCAYGFTDAISTSSLPHAK